MSKPLVILDLARNISTQFIGSESISELLEEIKENILDEEAEIDLIVMDRSSETFYFNHIKQEPWHDHAPSETESRSDDAPPLSFDAQALDVVGCGKIAAILNERFWRAKLEGKKNKTKIVYFSQNLPLIHTENRPRSYLAKDDGFLIVDQMLWSLRSLDEEFAKERKRRQ